MEVDMSQNQQILSHLGKSSITPMEALKRYKCFRLAARINDLRAAGHAIDCKMVYLGEKKFARYSLIKRKTK
jgi:hypothetical protein